MLTANPPRQIVNPKTGAPWANIIAPAVARRALPDADQWEVAKVGDRQWALVRKRDDANRSDDTTPGADVQTATSSSAETMPMQDEQPKPVATAMLVRADADKVRVSSDSARTRADAQSAEGADPAAAQDRLRSRWRRAQKSRRDRMAEKGLVSLRLMVTSGEAQQLRAMLEALRTAKQTEPSPAAPLPTPMPSRPVPQTPRPTTPKAWSQMTKQERVAAIKQRCASSV